MHKRPLSLSRLCIIYWYTSWYIVIYQTNYLSFFRTEYRLEAILVHYNAGVVIIVVMVIFCRMTHENNNERLHSITIYCCIILPCIILPCLCLHTINKTWLFSHGNNKRSLLSTWFSFRTVWKRSVNMVWGNAIVILIRGSLLYHNPYLHN